MDESIKRLICLGCKFLYNMGSVIGKPFTFQTDSDETGPFFVDTIM